MNQSSSKDNDRWKKIAGVITVLAAIVTIIAFVFPKPDKNIEKIRKLLEEQRELALFPNRTVIPDSVLNANPTLKEINGLQSEIIQYFLVCDRLNFPPENDLTYETKKIVCMQNLKILIELGDITQSIDNHIRDLMSLEPSVTTYIDVPGLENVNETNKQLNEALKEVYEKIGTLSDDKQKINTIWKFLDSKELYSALEGKKDAYTLLFKACEIVINKQR